MKSQPFTHDNEILAFAPIGNDQNGSLFREQSVWVSPENEMRWDFILHNGKDWHFAEKMRHISDERMLSHFKVLITETLLKEGR